MENPKVTPEMLDKVDIDEKTQKIVHYSFMGAQVIASVGVDKIVKGMGDIVCANTPKRLDRLAVRIGQFAISGVVNMAVAKAAEKAEIFTIATIKAVKVYKQLKEENDGSDTIAESESEEE